MATPHELDDDDLIYETRGAVGIIRINRADRLGAFTWSMLGRSAAALRAASEDDAVRAVVLTGTGRGFCTGVDLDEMAAVRNTPFARKRVLSDRVHRVARGPWPTSTNPCCAP
jgi:enoyl-CoA hydratase/carnithine racemase